MKTLEMIDPTTGALVATNSLARFREDNAEDAEVLDALDRLECGDVREELVGFYRLRVLYTEGGAS